MLNILYQMLGLTRNVSFHLSTLHCCSSNLKYLPVCEDRICNKDMKFPQPWFVSYSFFQILLLYCKHHPYTWLSVGLSILSRKRIWESGYHLSSKFQIWWMVQLLLGSVFFLAFWIYDNVLYIVQQSYRSSATLYTKDQKHLRQYSIM